MKQLFALFSVIIVLQVCQLAAAESPATTSTPAAASATTNVPPSIAPITTIDTVVQNFLYAIFVLYLIQAFFAYWKASKPVIASQHSLLRWLLCTPDGLNSFWTFFVIAVILSIGIPLAQEVAGPGTANLPPASKTALVTYHLTTGCLLVFITLEVSCLYDMLQTKTFDWLALLLVSLVIDVIAFFLLSNAGEPIKSPALPANSYTTKYLLFTTGTALISSASTILFARTQGLLGENNIMVLPDRKVA